MNFIKFYIFLDFHVHATFTQKLRVHAIHDHGVDMDTGVYLVRVYVHLTLLCIKTGWSSDSFYRSKEYWLNCDIRIFHDSVMEPIFFKIFEPGLR